MGLLCTDGGGRLGGAGKEDSGGLVRVLVVIG